MCKKEITITPYGAMFQEHLDEQLQSALKEMSVELV